MLDFEMTDLEMDLGNVGFEFEICDFIIYKLRYVHIDKY